MKLVTWHEFIQMPEGTIYSEIGGLCAIGLCIKGETRIVSKNEAYTDYLESDLLPVVSQTSKADYEETVGSEIMMEHPSGWGRNGLFERDRKYWIWEREDRERLARWLLNPEAVAASEELNEDNVRWHGMFDDLEVAA